MLIYLLSQLFYSLLQNLNFEQIETGMPEFFFLLNSTTPGWQTHKQTIYSTFVNVKVKKNWKNKNKIIKTAATAITKMMMTD